MSARDELLDRLIAEQHNGGGWRTPPSHWNAAGPSVTVLVGHDDEVTIARRRRELAEDFEGSGDPRQASA